MKNFNELNISEPVLRAIQDLGYETPSPIQAETLPILLDEPTDFLGLAATGTGKTAAFGIPLLERLDPKARGVQALVLCPTRELAIQVAGQLDLLGKHLRIKALPVYGGAGYGDQIYGLKRGAQIVVGTPGRVVDHLTRGTLSLENLQTLVLDEADEMISMGFQEDMETVMGSVPEGQANFWLFSATMGREVRKVADAYLRDPKQVQVNRTEMLPDTLEQVYYATAESNKPEVLCKLIDAADDFYGIIFCQTKALVIDLQQYLAGRGYRADCLHGDMDQNARTRTMNAFRDRRVQILVATDVACRGLDVKDISHVVNYSIPRELDNYVHRIGRTGRSGKKGIAISLVTPSHRGLLGRVERLTKTKIKEGKIPTRKDIGQKQLAKKLADFQGVTTQGRALELMGGEWRAAFAEMDTMEVAARFLTLLSPEIFAERAEAEKARHVPRGPVIAPRTGDSPRAPRGEIIATGRREERPRPARAPDKRQERERFAKRPRPHGKQDSAVGFDGRPLNRKQVRWVR